MDSPHESEGEEMTQRVLPPIEDDLVPLLAAVIEATLVHKRAQNLREPSAARSHQLSRLEKLNVWARGLS